MRWFAMRFRRRNTFLLVYVKAKDLKIPITVPLPIVVAEELLQAAVVITWLCTPFLKDHQLIGGLRMKAEAYSITLPLSWTEAPWKCVAAIRKMITALRYVGPITFVEVESEDVHVLVKLM
jgi:hypothetical protein